MGERRSPHARPLPVVGGIAESVVSSGSRTRTQDGHMRNDTRDVSRRILEASLWSDLQEKLCRE